MSCLNCNRETVGKAVFCEQCQQEMEGYPIPKGTMVLIPSQPSPAPVKKQTGHLLGSLEDQFLLSKRVARRLAVAFGITLFLLVLTSATLGYVVMLGVPDFVTDALAHL